MKGVGEKGQVKQGQKDLKLDRAHQEKLRAAPTVSNG